MFVFVIAGVRVMCICNIYISMVISEIFNSSILHFWLIMKHFLKWRFSTYVFLKFCFYIYIIYVKSFYKLYSNFSVFNVLNKLLSILLFNKIYHNWDYSSLRKTHERMKMLNENAEIILVAYALHPAVLSCHYPYSYYTLIEICQ